MTTDTLRGKFIAFEGIDGAGKFTQLHRVFGWLEEKGIDVVWSSEPNSGSPLGKLIRSILNHEVPKPSDPLEFQRLYVLDRAQDIACFIRPSTERGNTYLIERYAFSTIAYGMLSGLTAEAFMELHTQLLGPSIIWPDLTVLIDIPAKEAVRRINSRRAKAELFEKQEILEKVRQNYLYLAHHPQFKNSTIVVDGTGSEDEVFEQIREELPRRFDFAK